MPSAQSPASDPVAARVSSSAALAETPDAPVASAECVIRGAGEIGGSQEHPFFIYPTRADLRPALIVQHPRDLHVTWSSLPKPGAAARAQVSLGGQALVRLSAWASLEGRHFQVRERAAIEDDHAWIRRGRTVSLLGFDDNQAIVSSPTELHAPTTLRAHTACENVAYEPDSLPQETVDSRNQDVLLARTVHLYASPGGRPLFAVTEDYLRATKIASDHNFVHVTFGTATMAFDAWIPNNEISANDRSTMGVGFGLRGMGTSGYGWSRTGTVLRDTELRVGRTPRAAIIGVVESKARVWMGTRAIRQSADRADYVSIGFLSREIEATNGEMMWIDLRDVAFD